MKPKCINTGIRSRAEQLKIDKEEKKIWDAINKARTKEYNKLWEYLKAWANAREYESHSDMIHYYDLADEIIRHTFFPKSEY